jgi:hypothetical protein
MINLYAELLNRVRSDEVLYGVRSDVLTEVYAIME